MMQGPLRDAVLKIVGSILERYPLSRLPDIYKSFFQDEFGPGHLLSDPGRARAYLAEELGSMVSRGRRAAEPCGLGLRFCRLPLDLVADGIIPEEAYFSAFAASAAAFGMPDPETWRERWMLIESVIAEEYRGLEGFAWDSMRIRESLGNGVSAMGHSEVYRRAYEPHYRVFTIEGQQLFSSQWGV